ncbi:hypothetical protein [Cytobacillus kochii]|uniref:Uncharacterized protein n=1 Tax=Cytobacillus kochii TaxID=859143 RepID=A0A248TPX0_9BACI|nr:hypothetical protein [Cytobacillus kochii]ASV70212.1 hypothetical protein CKF48_23290 [Cytobacillus kochii]
MLISFDIELKELGFYIETCDPGDGMLSEFGKVDLLIKSNITFQGYGMPENDHSFFIRTTRNLDEDLENQFSFY